MATVPFTEPPPPPRTRGEVLLQILRPPIPLPGFWLALLACIAFIVCTQFPPALVFVVMLVVLAAIDPERYPLQMTSTEQLLTSEASRLSMLVTVFVTQVLVILFSLLVIRVVVGPTWRRQLALRLPSLSHLILVLIGFPAVVLLGNGSYVFIREVIRVPSLSDSGIPAMEEVMKMVTTWPLVPAVLVIGLGPGIGEELWCRGFLGRGLVARYGVWWGVLFTSFFFGLIHVDPAQGLMAVVMGVVLHYAYLMTRSLWVPILLHFMNNSFAVVASRFEGVEAVEKNPEVIPWYVFAAAGMLLVAVGWALYHSRARVYSAEGEPMAQPYPGVADPPLDQGYIASSKPGLGITTGVLIALALFLTVCVTAASANLLN